MILDIKGKKKEKRIQLIGGLIGICVAVSFLFYFFHAEKAEAEKRMVEIVNYVKVQCSTYTHYNESSESKSLLRAIESARPVSYTHLIHSFCSNCCLNLLIFRNITLFPFSD